MLISVLVLQIAIFVKIYGIYHEVCKIADYIERKEGHKII